MTRRIMFFFAACAACLAFAAPVQADLTSVLLNDYVDDQQLDPCRYSEKQLKGLRDAIPNDAAAYAADFAAAIDDALARRAQGACKKGGATTSNNATAPPASSGTTPPPPVSSTPAPSTGTPAPTGAPAVAQPPPTPATAPVAAPDVAVRDAIALAVRNASDPATDPPFPLLALAVLAGLLALGTALYGLIRWRAWQPAWADHFSHAAGEAGWRASSTWAEFSDFVRFGR